MANDLILRDLKIIYNTNKSIDYSNKVKVSAWRKKLIETDALKTNIGKDYIKKLDDIENDNNSHDCVVCHKTDSETIAVCPSCILKLESKFAPKKTVVNTDATAKSTDNVASNNAPANNESQVAPSISIPSNIDAVELGKKATEVADKTIKQFANKVNELAGGDGEVVVKFRDLFTDVFKRHKNEEAEQIFICGTAYTTPNESEITAEWPKPWLFSRIMLILFAAFYLLILCWTAFHNTNVLPDIIFIGSSIMPISVLIFLFEMNVPRNISLITTLKVFFVGGAASLIVTLLLFEFFQVDQLNYVGAMIVGFVEELGKAIIVYFGIKQTKKCKYIFNGILIGGAVGAGFAVFESAGYAFRIYISSLLGGAELAYNNMINNIYLRGIMSPGGHVAWAAITGAAIMIVTHGDIKGLSFIKDKRFFSMFLIIVLLHGIWDCPLNILGTPFIKIGILIVVAWIVLIVLINNALKEINGVNKS